MDQTMSELRVEIVTASRQYDRRDPAFLDQVAELRRALAATGVPLVQDERHGYKGGELDSVVQAVVVGGAGLTSLCGVVTLWLRQRGHRLVRLTVRTPNGGEQTVEVEGRSVTDKTLLTFAERAVRQLR